MAESLEPSAIDLTAVHRSVRIVSGDRIVVRSAPLGGEQRSISAPPCVEYTGRIPPYSNVALAVTVVIILRIDVRTRYPE